MPFKACLTNAGVKRNPLAKLEVFKNDVGNEGKYLILKHSLDSEPSQDPLFHIAIAGTASS